MSESKTTRALMITSITVTFIAIAIALALTPYTTSVKGTAPSSSGIVLCKHFEYSYLLDSEGWKPGDEFISGLEVELYKSDCGNLIAVGETDANGDICWDGLTEGDYHIKFSWNGQAYEEHIFLCCNKGYWEFKDNYLPPKGEDGAFSSFSSEVASPTLFLGF